MKRFLFLTELKIPLNSFPIDLAVIKTLKKIKIENFCLEKSSSKSSTSSLEVEKNLIFSFSKSFKIICLKFFKTLNHVSSEEWSDRLYLL